MKVRYKWKWVVFSTFIVIVLAVCGYFVINNRNTPISINVQFPKNLKTAMNLISVAEPYIQNYWKGKTYHVGHIYMDVNIHHEGETRITYSSEPKSGNPEIIVVVFDTKNGKLIQINRYEKLEKLDYGEIAINKWKVDSIDAFNIAEESSKQEKEKFEYDKVIISTLNRGTGSWDVELFSPNKVYRCIIDPYDGEILDKRFRNLN